MSCPVDGLVEVCIVEDNGRTLSTELKGDILEVALGSSLHDLPADEGRASEGNLFDTRVLGDGLTDGRSVPNNEVEDTRGEASFANHIGGDESGQRGQFGGLHDDGVSGGESGADLPAQHHDCENTDIRRCVQWGK
jgi:hypothetical protein